MPRHRFRGIVIPNLKDTLSFQGRPLTREQQLEETRSGAKEVISNSHTKEVPLCTEHGVRVGTVWQVMNSQSGRMMYSEFEIDDSTMEGFKTLCLVQSGVLSQLSLGHNRRTKEIFEVSIVESGAREGSFITHALVDADKSGNYTEVPFDRYISTHRANVNLQKAVDNGDRETFSDIVVATNRKLALGSYRHSAAMSSGPKPPSNIRLHKPKRGADKYAPTENGSDKPGSTSAPERIRLHRSGRNATQYEDEAENAADEHQEDEVYDEDDDGEVSWDEELPLDQQDEEVVEASERSRAMSTGSGSRGRSAAADQQPDESFVDDLDDTYNDVGEDGEQQPAETESTLAEFGDNGEGDEAVLNHRPGVGHSSRGGAATSVNVDRNGQITVNVQRNDPPAAGSPKSDRVLAAKGEAPAADQPKAQKNSKPMQPAEREPADSGVPAKTASSWYGKPAPGKGQQKQQNQQQPQQHLGAGKQKGRSVSSKDAPEDKKPKAPAGKPKALPASSSSSSKGSKKGGSPLNRAPPASSNKKAAAGPAKSAGAPAKKTAPSSGGAKKAPPAAQKKEQKKAKKQEKGQQQQQDEDGDVDMDHNDDADNDGHDGGSGEADEEGNEDQQASSKTPHPLSHRIMSSGEKEGMVDEMIELHEKLEKMKSELAEKDGELNNRRDREREYFKTTMAPLLGKVLGPDAKGLEAALANSNMDPAAILRIQERLMDVSKQQQLTDQVMASLRAGQGKPGASSANRKKRAQLEAKISRLEKLRAKINGDSRSRKQYEGNEDADADAPRDPKHKQQQKQQQQQSKGQKRSRRQFQGDQSSDGEEAARPKKSMKSQSGSSAGQQQQKHRGSELVKASRAGNNGGNQKRRQPQQQQQQSSKQSVRRGGGGGFGGRPQRVDEDGDLDLNAHADDNDDDEQLDGADSDGEMEHEGDGRGAASNSDDEEDDEDEDMGQSQDDRNNRGRGSSGMISIPRERHTGRGRGNGSRGREPEREQVRHSHSDNVFASAPKGGWEAAGIFPGTAKLLSQYHSNFGGFGGQGVRLDMFPGMTDRWRAAQRAAGGPSRTAMGSYSDGYMVRAPDQQQPQSFAHMEQNLRFGNRTPREHVPRGKFGKAPASFALDSYQPHAIDSLDAAANPDQEGSFVPRIGRRKPGRGDNGSSR